MIELHDRIANYGIDSMSGSGEHDAYAVELTPGLWEVACEACGYRQHFSNDDEPNPETKALVCEKLHNSFHNSIDEIEE